MSKDIRITIGLCDHPKTVKLVRKVGEGGFRCLLRLWSYAACHRPQGELSGMDATDLAIASGWAGDEQEWISALVAVGFIDDNDGALSLHDWERHNPFAFHSEERSQKARAAAKAKWDKRSHANRNAPSSVEHSDEQEPADAPSPIPTPSPSPSPSPINTNPNGLGGEPPSVEKMVFDIGREILGSNAGGQIAKLRKLVGNDVAVLSVLNEAKGKSKPAEWIAGVIRQRTPEPPRFNKDGKQYAGRNML